MKKNSIKATVVLSISAVAFSAILLSSCTKEGPIGPAGSDGVQGPSGTNGSDGSLVTAADQSAYAAADGLIGGRIYDDFTKQLSITDTAYTNHKDFFRCKQCHGWDLRGSNGAYINRAPNATRPAVASNDLYTFAKASNIKQVFDAIKHEGGRAKLGNGTDKSLNASMPDFSLILTDAQIWQITKYLKTEALNTFNLYDINTTGYYPTGTKTFSNVGKDGSAANGNATFASLCAGCHGANGTQIVLDGGTAYMGDFMRSSPYEFQHKARCGQSGTSMPTFSANTESTVKDFLKAGQDALAYPGF